MTSNRAFEQFVKDLTAQSFNVLKQSLARAEAIEKITSTMKLGESSRRNFIAHASESLNPHASDSRTEMEKLLPTIEIIKRYKRKIAFKMGDLTLVSGKYGVTFYYMPLEAAIGNFRMSMQSVLNSKFILDYIGATADGWDKGDTIYNYSKCAVPATQNAA
jgi:hypothetical protein